MTDLAPITHCPVLALVGRPNVGKSTLFNRLTKSTKAIVDPTPGVTRDRHYERVILNEQAFILVDTAGIELGHEDGLVGQVREQTKHAIQEADAILFMLDSHDGLLAEDYEVATILRRSDKPVFFLINKIDSPVQEEKSLAPFYELGVDPLLSISATTGYGISTFIDHLVEHLTGSTEFLPLPENTIRIACIGRPNVGKSSLVNRLLGEERMVVSEVPGTTRDSVDSLLKRGEQHYLLIDTAGIRRRGKVQEKIEKYSVLRALSSIERCDIVLILFDADEGITEQDTKVIGYALEQGRACLILINKWDLVRSDTKRQRRIMEEIERATGFVGFAPVFPISALTGYGVNRIFEEIRIVFEQFNKSFTTNRLNNILRDAVEAHDPAFYQGHKLKFYYVTQVKAKPPTFIVFVNYPQGVHFSYQRFLVNQFRAALKLDRVPVRIVLKERERRDLSNLKNEKKGRGDRHT